MASSRRLQRRTLRVLAVAQVFGGVGFFLGVTVAALLARDVSGEEALSGLPLALGIATAAIAAAPLTTWMARAGRRTGLAAGHLIAAAGAAVVVGAAALDSFLVLCLGVAAFGLANTSNLLARYAATDLASPQARARAISVVLLATAAGAIAGPNLASSTAPLAVALGVPASAGPFVVAVAANALAAVILLAFLRPDPLLAARAEDAGEAAPRALGWTTELRRIPSWPRFAITGVAAMAASNVAMIAIMTMTPIHMEVEGQSLSAIGLVLSLHVAGMYLPSPISGWLADRAGRLPVVAAGGLTLVLAGVLAAVSPGDHVPLMAAALTLLGIGWNMGLVGGSALVTDAMAVERRPQAQGAADLVMGLTGVTGSLVAGPLFHAGAFAVLGVGAAALGCLLLALVASGRAGAAAPAG
jgi:MFS family permease